MDWRNLALASLIERLHLAVAVTRPDGRIEYANPCLQALLAAPDGQLLGQRLDTFRKNPVPIDGAVWQGESRFRTQAGNEIEVLEAVYPLRDERRVVAYLIHFLQDASAHRHAERLNALAFYDSLTGLPNRNLFDDRLTRAILGAERRGGGFALFYIDVDSFKSINDGLGHAAGDRLLRGVAERMTRALRKTDTLARLGGDEFAAIVEDVQDHAAATAIAEKLFVQCKESYDLNGNAVNVTFSVGIGIYPQDGRDAATLLEHADRAMYQAKAQGRNRYCTVPAPYGLDPAAA